MIGGMCWHDGRCWEAIEEYIGNYMRRYRGIALHFLGDEAFFCLGIEKVLKNEYDKTCVEGEWYEL